MTETPRRFYRLSEVAQQTGLSKSFVRSCVRDGLLRAERFRHSPRVWLVAAEELERFLQASLVAVREGEQ